MNQLLGSIPVRPSDRRGAARYQPAFGTVCRLGAVNTRRVTALVWDLSATGVSMLMSDPPEEGSVFAAELAAEMGDERLSVTLEVVHARPVSTGDYFIGARFARPLSRGEMEPFITPQLGAPLPVGNAS